MVYISPLKQGHLTNRTFQLVTRVAGLEARESKKKKDNKVRTQDFGNFGGGDSLP